MVTALVESQIRRQTVRVVYQELCLSEDKHVCFRCHDPGERPRNVRGVSPGDSSLGRLANLPIDGHTTHLQHSFSAAC